MKKRLCAALMAACFSVTMALPTLASPAATPAQQVAQVVNALGIMVGDSSGNMNLSNKVSRAEFITMAVKATPSGDQIGQAATSPYPDIPWTHWASGYVEAGVAMGLVSGYTDGTFRPTSTITLAEGAAIALTLLGYAPADFSGSYPTGQMAMYRSLKLDRGLHVTAPTDHLTRQDAMHLFYNLLTAPTKQGGAYLTTLGYALNAAGEIDLLGLLNDAMEGPLVAQSGWQDSLPMAVGSATIYRNGAPVSASAIQSYDVIYWNKSMSTLWAYSDRVSGTIQALAPSSSHPTSVTVAGRTCAIETAQAAYALSDLGSYKLGDTVSLLLGRDGKVAAVTGAMASGQGERMGLITNVENATYDDGKGGSYYAQTLTLLATDGQTYRYEYPTKGINAGALVRIATAANGQVTVRSLSKTTLTGRVNGTGTQLGGTPFASNVEILDIRGTSALRVYPSRLTGIQVADSMVRYHAVNTSGEIEYLVLNNVTGDMDQYGVLTKISEGDAGGETYFGYELNVGGTQITLPQGTTRYPVTRGAIQLQGQPQNPDKLVMLTSARTGEISGKQFVAGAQTYTLSEAVAVYELRGEDYYLSTLARVQAGDVTLVGWYDKTDTAGGRLRVLIAQDKS